MIAAPSDENECRQLLYTAWKHEGPAAVRYPRGTGPGTDIEQAMNELPIGQGRELRQGREVVILNFGASLATALTVAERIDASVCDMRFVKPLDTALIERMAESHALIVTVEENAIAGGAGSAVGEHLASRGIATPWLPLGFRDEFAEHDSQKKQLASQGLDADGIEQAIRAYRLKP